MTLTAVFSRGSLAQSRRRATELTVRIAPPLARTNREYVRILISALPVKNSRSTNPAVFEKA